MDEELKRLIEEVGAETRRHIDVVAESLRQENAENRQQIGTVAADLRLHFDITAEDLRHQMQFCAESIVGTGERLDRRINGLETDMKASSQKSKP